MFTIGLSFNQLFGQCPHIKAACNNTFGDLRYAVAEVNLPGVAYFFSGFLINNTSNNGRLLFMTSYLPFSASCFNPNNFIFNNATFTWNKDYTSCSGGASTTVVSTGATLLASYGNIALLELHEPPNLPELTYLGWDITTEPTSVGCIFQSEFDEVKKGIVTSGSPTIASVNVQCNGDFTEASGLTNFLKISAWNEPKLWRRGRGAPLIMNNKKVAGVYVVGNDQNNCNSGSFYFYDVALAANSTLFSYLRGGSQTNSATIRRAYCRASENLSGQVNANITYSVSGLITSTQNITDGKSVRYQAGTYIELNPGFVSGTDFVADINPCSNAVTIIAAKTDDSEQTNRNNFEVKQLEDLIKVYPTILSSGNTITIEANDAFQGVELQMFDMQGKQNHSFKLKGSITSIPLNLISGMYILKAHNGTNFFTKKIVIQ